MIVRTPRNSECSLLLRTARALLDAPDTRRALAGALLVAALLPGALLAAPSTALAAASAQAAPLAALPAEVTTTSTDPGCAVKSEEPEGSWSNRTADTTDKLSDWYTDAAGVLDKQAVSEAVLALEEERKIVMYIVTCDHSPTDGVDAWADSIWNQTFIASRKAIDSPGYVPARNVVLLVIDTEAGEYAWRVADGTSIASYRTSAMEKALVEGQAEGGYSAGVVAAANALRTARNPWIVRGIILLVAVAAVVLGRKGWRAWSDDRARRAREERQRESEAAAMTALVEADEAVRARADDLAYAVAQLGTEETLPYARALEEASGLVAEGLEASRSLEWTVLGSSRRLDAVKTMRTRASRAQALLATQDKAVAALRAEQADVAQVLESTAERVALAREATAAAEEVINALAAVPAGAVENARKQLGEARERLAEAERAVEEGRQADREGRARQAVERSRLAQVLLDQAQRLTTTARTVDREVRRAQQALPDRIRSISRDLEDAQRLSGPGGAEGTATQGTPAPALGAGPRPGAVLDPEVLGEAVGAAIAARGAALEAGDADPRELLEALKEAEEHLDAVLDPARQAEERLARAVRILPFLHKDLDRQVKQLRATLQRAGRYVGSQARASLADAVDLGEQSRRLADADPVQAVALARQGTAAVGEARRMLEADLDRTRPSYWDSPLPVGDRRDRWFDSQARGWGSAWGAGWDSGSSSRRGSGSGGSYSSGSSRSSGGSGSFSSGGHGRF